MRVLLIEDTPRLAEAVAEILRKSGYGADIAHIGADGLAMALAGAYDVLLLDIMLPDMSGMDVLRELRESGSVVPVSCSPPDRALATEWRGSTPVPTIIFPSRFMQASCSLAFARSRADRQLTDRTMRSRRVGLCLMCRRMCCPLSAKAPYRSPLPRVLAPRLPR